MGYADWLMRQVLPANRVYFHNDDACLDLRVKKQEFVVVIVRNPCDWYVSWAHNNPGKAFGYKQETFGPNNLGRGRKPPLSMDEFRTWLLNVRFPDGKGFMSFYIWQMLIAPECYQSHIMHAKGKQENRWPRCSNVTQMWAELSAFQPPELAHCWIFHESFMEDFRNCLRAYESSSPRAQGSVNWTRFND